MNNYFIILAGGKSKRFNSHIPKAYHLYRGKPLLLHSIDRAKSYKKINKILVVINKKHKKFIKRINLKNIRIIEGGKTRAESSFKALKSIQKLNINLIDLKSRFKSFIQIGIDFPTDDLLKVIISKSFSDKQIDLNTRNLEYILKNIDRSYDKVFEFIKDLDEKSLSTGKSININLIKKVLNK